MKHFRSYLPLLCFALLYCGCEKADNPASHASTTASNKVNTLTIYSPENVAVKSIPTDTLVTDFKSLGPLFQGTPSKIETDGTPTLSHPLVYDGYSKTYDCTSNNWTYVFTWGIFTNSSKISNGLGGLTVGTFTTSAAFTIVSQTTVSPGGVVNTVQYTLIVPNDANYCNSTTLQESISYVVTPLLGRAIDAVGGNTESADPNVYQTYPFLVGGSFANGNGTYELEVAPGVLTCQTECHVAALGFPPTVYFYYHLVGSPSAWSETSQAGSDLNGFDVQVSQAGTYEYYTQEDTAPGVLSGEINYGQIAVN
jgi:hypothetical protein